MLVKCLFTRPMLVLFGADPVHRIRAWFSWLSWNFLMKTICQDIPATLAVLGGGSYNSFSDGFDLLPCLLNGEPWPRFLNSKNKGWSKRRRKHILQISANISLCPKNGLLLFREEIVFIDHNESNGTINALRLGNSFIVIISSPWSRLPRSPLCTLYYCQGAYKAHWMTEGNIMSYSKDIACIDVQRRSSLLFGDKSHFWMFWRGWMLFALQYSTYLIFVIFFTRAKFLENKIYTEKRQFFALNL